MVKKAKVEKFAKAPIRLGEISTQVDLAYAAYKIRSYNPDDLPFEVLREIWDGTNWVLEFRSQNFYNENGDLFEILAEYFENISFSP